MPAYVSIIAAIVVIAFLVVFMIIGFRKGFLRILFTTFSVVIVIALSALLTQPISEFLNEKTSVGSFVSTRISTFVNERTESLETDLVIGAEDTFVDSLPLPGFLKTDIKENNTINNYAEMGVRTFAEYVSARLTSIVMKALTFVILALVIFIILRIIVFLLKIIDHIPIIRGINRLFGAILGLLEGLLILWCIFIFIMIFSGTTFGTTCMEVIAGSKVLTFLYDHNVPVIIFSQFIGR